LNLYRLNARFIFKYLDLTLSFSFKIYQFGPVIQHARFGFKSLESRQPSLLILGTRGVPAAHGGFETFAERLALYLVAKGWHVGVYCQEEVERVETRFRSTFWQGVEQINVAVSSTGPRATLEFDWHCVRNAASRPGVCLVLGYNGAVFLPYLLLKNRKIITNMDGIEWRRPKWNAVVRAWFWVNEWIAAWTSHRLIADHPRIADHLASRRSRHVTAMIPYGGETISAAPESCIRTLGLEPNGYLVSIARIEPDNSILQIVEAFSRRRRGAKLAVLGDMDNSIPYHRAVRAAAGDEVVLTGAIYDKTTVEALRFHARAYVHGHMVGGTNPSLVAALGAGNAVIARDNEFNRWTAGDAALYFSSIDDCDVLIDRMLHDDKAVACLRAAATARVVSQFAWADVLAAYEHELVALSREAQATPERNFSRAASRNP
jgi:glycosyltransferase involved in cell wall biosynthesis